MQLLNSLKRRQKREVKNEEKDSTGDFHSDNKRGSLGLFSA